jgi:hypothetical protein
MKLLHKLFPSLQVRAEIKKIIREEYGNYKGNMLQELKAAHKHLRKVMGAKEFLNFLQQQIVSNPRPRYNYPFLMSDQNGQLWEINAETLEAVPGPTGCNSTIIANQNHDLNDLT